MNKQLLIIEGLRGILLWRRPPTSRRLAGFWELPEPAQLPGVIVEKIIGQFRHTIVNTTYRFRVLEGSVHAAPNGFCYLPEELLSEVPLSTIAKKALVYLQGRKRVQPRGEKTCQENAKSAP